MSVTIQISDGRAWVRRYAPELVTSEDYRCDTCRGTGKLKAGPFTTGCAMCKARGIIRVEEYPYEMNLANGNFCTIWSALGLDPTPSGGVDHRVLADALNGTPLDLIVRRERTVGSTLVCGLPEEKAARYIQTLGLIVAEAARRDRAIVWG